MAVGLIGIGSVLLKLGRLVEKIDALEKRIVEHDDIYDRLSDHDVRIGKMEVHNDARNFNRTGRTD